MQLGRMFINDNYKGTRDYLNSQKKYEILRTVIYFAISISLFAAGWIHTGSRENLLTVVAALGCLPGCKSAVDMIMFLRYKSCSRENADTIDIHCEGLTGIYDMVFTSYDKNYQVDHLTVRGNTICGFTENSNLDEQAFYKHIDSLLKKDNFKDTSIKIFKDIKKYTDRLEQLKTLPAEENLTVGIVNTLKSVSL